MPLFQAHEVLGLVAMQKASEYWEANSEEIAGILDDSALAVYDVDALGFNFRKAVSNSTLYQLISRCLGNPDDYFGFEDFSDVFDFNTPQTAAALGTAVNTISSEILRQIEITIRSYNRNQERSQNNEAAGVSRSTHKCAEIPQAVRLSEANEKSLCLPTATRCRCQPKST